MAGWSNPQRGSFSWRVQGIYDAALSYVIRYTDGRRGLGWLTRLADWLR